jgi:hypothetical protein
MLGREIEVGEGGNPDYVRYWQKADMAIALSDVRFRG